MNTIGTRLGTEMAILTVGAESSPGSDHGKVPVQSTTVNSPQAHVDPAQTDVSFTTYGPNDEHTAIVVTHGGTGEVIREIPSKVMQKIRVHIDTLI